jgi:hypothetical protein
MKKLFLSALVVISALAGQVRASESDVFKVNDAQVNEEFAQLNKIEDFVLSHEGVSYDEMKSQNPELVAGLNESPDSFTGIGSSLRGGESPLGIPPFVWGCVLGWVGILIVYFVAEDREMTKKAFYGCLVGGLAGLIIYFVYFVLVLGTAFGSI